MKIDKNYSSIVYKLITRENIKGYSPNNIKSIEISPKNIICHYHHDDKNGNRQKLSFYSLVSTKSTYDSILELFTKTKHNNESHKCQNLEEIIIKTSDITDTSILYISPKDINLLDILVGSTDGAKVSASLVKAIKTKYDAQISNLLTEIENKSNIKLDDLTNIAQSNMILQQINPNVCSLLSTMVSDNQVIELLHKAFPRLRKIIIRSCSNNSENTIKEQILIEDDSYLLAIGAKSGNYAPDTPYTKEETLSLLNKENAKDKNTKEKDKAKLEIKTHYRNGFLRDLYLLKLDYERAQQIEKDTESKDSFEDTQKDKFKKEQEKIINLEKIYTQLTKNIVNKANISKTKPFVVYNCEDIIKFNSNMLKHNIITVEKVTSYKEAFNKSILAYTNAIEDIIQPIVQGLTQLLQGSATDKIIINSLKKKYPKFIVGTSLNIPSIDTASTSTENTEQYLKFIYSICKVYLLYTTDMEYKF